MQESNKHKPEFSPGDVVSHGDWGVGCVVEVGTGPQADIVVGFPSKPERRVSLQLAKHSLSKLPANGLEALLLKERETVASWGKVAPLKLVGAALADMGKAVKPAQLKAKLDGRQLLPLKWESWWRRVQPILKQSSCFSVRYDGSFELVSALEEIPAEPLPAAPKKTRETRITKSEVLKLVSKLEAGQMKFEDLKGVKTRHAVAREIVRRTEVSEWARATVNKVLAGSALAARVMLQELAKSSSSKGLVEAFAELTRHLQHLATVPAAKKGREKGEHITAKLHVLEDAVLWFTTHEEPEWEPHIIAGLVTELVTLALLLWRKDVSGWRSKSLDCVSSILARLGEREQDVFAFVGEHLTRYKGDTSTKIAIADNLLTKAKSYAGPSAVDKLLMASLFGAPGFVQELFLRYVKKEQQLPWISSALSKALASCDGAAIETLANLLVRKSPGLQLQDSRVFVDLAIAAASVSPQAEAALTTIIEHELKERLRSLASEIPDITAPPTAGTILDAIESALRTELEKERQKAKGAHTQLQSEIEDLRQALDASRSKSTRLEKMVEQLRSGYRVPEQWASFQGEKDVLEQLVVLYQEAFLTRGSAVDVQVADWVLNRLENIFQTHGLSRFGEVGSSQTYDPSLHEFIPGFETAGDEIKIRCPGFRWHDPAGNQIIIARAKVMRP